VFYNLIHFYRKKRRPSNLRLLLKVNIVFSSFTVLFDYGLTPSYHTAGNCHG
jgi:hypothetical protein